MTRATKNENVWERQSTEGESRIRQMWIMEANTHLRKSSSSDIGPQDPRKTPFKEKPRRTLRGISTGIKCL